jgi:hypothetical protein
MVKSLGSLKGRDDGYLFEDGRAGFRCDGCNGAFERPVLATVSSSGSSQTYYACPRCLSKVSDVKYDKREEGGETSVLMGKVRKVAVKREDSVKCEHFLGFLKKRPKDMPIPDECLTCDKMIECLAY